VDKKLKNHLRLIARIRHFVLLFVRNLICKSVMFLVMNYGIQVWGHTYDRHLKSLEVTQRTAAKLITFSKIGVDSNLIFKNLKCMPLKESIDYFSSVYIFKGLNGWTSQNSKDFFVRNESQQKTRSRVREELKFASFKRRYMQNKVATSSQF
jgi:hypothetical protein